MQDQKPKILRTSITKDIGPYRQIVADFETERYDGEPLLDTRVNLHVQDFAITYDQRDAFMTDLAKIIKKYQI